MTNRGLAGLPTLRSSVAAGRTRWIDCLPLSSLYLTETFHNHRRKSASSRSASNVMMDASPNRYHTRKMHSTRLLATFASKSKHATDPLENLQGLRFVISHSFESVELTSAFGVFARSLTILDIESDQRTELIAKTENFSLETRNLTQSHHSLLLPMHSRQSPEYRYER